QKCIGCKSCSLACPMEAMVIEERKAVNCVHNCILCGVCISKCPEKAIRYGRKNDEE
ncbi:4Fe-4S binding protein, partial [Phascolarctobacterium faecium]